MACSAQLKCNMHVKQQIDLVPKKRYTSIGALENDFRFTNILYYIKSHLFSFFCFLYVKYFKNILFYYSNEISDWK